MKNIVPNGNFQEGKLGSLPDNWEVKSAYAGVTPLFVLFEVDGKKLLKAQGNGNINCNGYLVMKCNMTGGQTYKMKVRFKMSDGINPNFNMTFSCFCPSFNDGIFKYIKVGDGWVEGENRFSIPGNGTVEGDVRFSFRLSAEGSALIEYISLEECEPIPARNVKIACTSGKGSMENWKKVLDFCGENHTDLALLPETFYHAYNELPEMESVEGYDGPSCTLMSGQAKKYGMYVTGSFVYRDEYDGDVYNSCPLFDRDGKLVGKYYKNHPFSPEFDNGIAPGVEIPVFNTDFGCVGIIICYDSWFTDVTELLALKGAEIVLFPNAGYFEGIMPARAADNCVRMVASSSGERCTIWDTSGTDIMAPHPDPSCYANCRGTYSEIISKTIDDLKVVISTLDLSISPSPHNWGGPMRSAQGGRRNRREQKALLLDQIKAEMERW